MGLGFAGCVISWLDLALQAVLLAGGTRLIAADFSWVQEKEKKPKLPPGHTGRGNEIEKRQIVKFFFHLRPCEKEAVVAENG